MTLTRGVLQLMMVTLALTPACGKAPSPPPKGVANEALGVRLVSIPPDFEVTSNEGDTLELSPSAPNVGGRLWFTVGHEDRGINLVAAVKKHQKRIEELPGADYRGGQELVTHLGTAFYSRGRFLTGTDETEETAVFIQHPTEARLLTISYRYPAAVDSSVRVEQLLAVLEQVEGISTQ